MKHRRKIPTYLPPVNLPLTLFPALIPFVARERELGTLQAALDSARAGRGQILFVIGGAGRGKSMLVQAFARQALENDANLIVVTGYCDAITGVSDPYLPFRQALIMLNRALALLKPLSENPEHSRRELSLQIALGNALIVTEGFAAPEVEKAFARAWELCQRVDGSPQQFPVLYGLWTYYTTRTEHKRA